MKKMCKMMEAILDEELEPISSYIELPAPDNVNVGLWYLGESLKLMAKADYFIGFGPYSNITSNYPGCDIETMAADMYDIPSFLITDEMTISEILGSIDLNDEHTVRIDDAQIDIPELMRRCNTLFEKNDKGGINDESEI